MSYLDSANESQYTAQLQTGGTIYRKVVLAGNEQAGQEGSQDTRTFPREMEPLIDFDDLDNVEAVKTEEVDGNTHYIVVISDEHSDEIIEENIDALENNIELFEEMDMPEEVISSVNTRIEEMRETIFSSLVNIY